MEKDASLFSSLSRSPKDNICVANDYPLIVVGNGDVECQHDHIYGIYHVRSLSSNLLSVTQLTKNKILLNFDHITLS